MQMATSFHTPNQDFIEELIESYVECVHSMVVLLKVELNCDDLLKGVKSEKFPRQGEIGVSERLSYRFHGIGCRVIGNGFEVDFDFVPSGVIGFDTWRLYNYWEHSLRSQMPLCSPAQEQIEAAVSQALSEGAITPIKERPGSHLFKLSC